MYNGGGGVEVVAAVVDYAMTADYAVVVVVGYTWDRLVCDVVVQMLAVVLIYLELVVHVTSNYSLQMGQDTFVLYEYSQRLCYLPSLGGPGGCKNGIDWASEVHTMSRFW